MGAITVDVPTRPVLRQDIGRHAQKKSNNQARPLVQNHGIFAGFQGFALDTTYNFSSLPKKNTPAAPHTSNIELRRGFLLSAPKQCSLIIVSL